MRYKGNAEELWVWVGYWGFLFFFSSKRFLAFLQYFPPPITTEAHEVFRQGAAVKISQVLFDLIYPKLIPVRGFMADLDVGRKNNQIKTKQAPQIKRWWNLILKAIALVWWPFRTLKWRHTICKLHDKCNMPLLMKAQHAFSLKNKQTQMTKCQIWQCGNSVAVQN